MFGTGPAWPSWIMISRGHVDQFCPPDRQEVGGTIASTFRVSRRKRSVLVSSAPQCTAELKARRYPPGHTNLSRTNPEGGSRRRLCCAGESRVWARFRQAVQKLRYCSTASAHIGTQPARCSPDHPGRAGRTGPKEPLQQFREVPRASPKYATSRRRRYPTWGRKFGFRGVSR